MTPEERAFCDRVTVQGNHFAKYHTFEATETILSEGIPGDFVECGVGSGGHETIIAYAFRKHGVEDRKIHCFDSFQGAPKATMEDSQDTRNHYGTATPGILELSHPHGMDIANLYRHFQQYDVPTTHLIFHQGWFEEVMEECARQISKIAFLRVDVNLYQSTLVCYQNLYRKVVKGGFVVDDDWSSEACRRAAKTVVPVQDLQGIQPVPSYPETSFWRKP